MSGFLKSLVQLDESLKFLSYCCVMENTIIQYIQYCRKYFVAIKGKYLFQISNVSAYVSPSIPCISGEGVFPIPWIQTHPVDPWMQTPLDLDQTRCRPPSGCRPPGDRTVWSCDLWCMLGSLPISPLPLDRQTPVKSLPSPKVRLREVKMRNAIP